MKSKLFFATLLIAVCCSQSYAQLKVLPTGFVSIGGNFTPVEKLHVLGNGVFSTITTFPNTATYAPMIRGGNGGVSTIANPDYTWYNDNRTGIFHPAAWQIAITLGGVQRVHFNWNGNVGIGVNNPPYQLTLSSYAAKPYSSTWIIYSDKKLKTNINPYKKGLDIVRQIELVSYEYNGMGGTPKGGKGIGVIAQDFQKVLPDAVNPFTYKNSENGTSEEFLGVDFHELFMVYANAIKELDTQNAALAKQVEDLVKQQENNEKLSAQVSELQKAMEAMSSEIGECCKINQNQSQIYHSENITNGSSLDQNIPNPFTEKTQINYAVASSVKNASISIFDMQGALLKTFDQLTVKEGKGSLTINGMEFKAGMYLYSLIVDGKETDTKRMILTK